MRWSTEVGYGLMGVGCIVIPVDINRDEHIRRCYDIGAVSLFVTEIGIITDVKIGQSIINLIEFPAKAFDPIISGGVAKYTPDMIGSMIAFFKTPKYNNYIGFDVLKKSNSVNVIGESNFKMSKAGVGGRVDIIGDAKTGGLIISVDSDINGVISIGINNKDGNGLLDIKVNGYIKAEANEAKITVYDKFAISIPNDSVESPTDITYIKGEGLSYKDEFGNELIIDKNGKLTYKNKTYSLKTLIDDIIDQISAITTATSIGAQPIINKLQVEALKQKVIEILS